MLPTTDTLIKSSGHEINYRYINPQFAEGNDKPFLVFLHEGLGSIRQWKDFPALLSIETGLPAMIYDRYGYGLSTPLQEKRDSGYLEKEGAVNLPALLNDLGIAKPVIVVGHSDGGSIALVFAGAYPGRVRGVISEAAHLFLEPISVSGIAETEKIFKQGRLKELLGRYHGERTETMFYGWAHTWQNPDFLNWTLENYLKTITAPTLAIQGENDEYGTEAQLDSITNNVKGYAEKMFIKDCGHVPHFQAKDLVLKKMVGFINDHCLL